MWWLEVYGEQHGMNNMRCESWARLPVTNREGVGVERSS